ncbi:MAG: transcription-repair coupling factor [Eggerthellaceae bacterium]|nr:transcription-repair coupling factor [Eggerthellaceae bacterium]
MLIDMLSASLAKSGALDDAWAKLDSGQDATVGVASSARPFLVAARFAADPRATLVVAAGEEAADTFARTVGAFVGEERVLRLPDYEGNPFSLDAPPQPRLHGRRLEALWSLQQGKPAVVVASARALLRRIAPAKEEVARPLALVAGSDLSEEPQRGIACFEDLEHCLVSMGYENSGKLDGPGTFSVQGGAIDVFPGNLAYPVRLDFFGDELDEIRRFLPSTGQTISSLKQVDIFPVREFAQTDAALLRAKRAISKSAETNAAQRDLLERLEDDSHELPDLMAAYLLEKTAAVGDYLSADALTVLIEPRSLVDDALHAYDELSKRCVGTSIPVSDLYMGPNELDFGANPRATYVSIMRVGVQLDSELVVKRVDVAGDPEKLFGRLRSLAEMGFTVVFSVPHFRARQEMKLSLVDLGIPINEVLDVVGDASPKLKRGQVNIVDVDIPLGMIFPAAKMALVSLSDTQGAMATRKRSRIDVTEITFPFKPGDYVVHAAHGVAFFRDIVRQDVGGSERDYLLLEYAEGDKLYVPVEQLDRVTRYVGPEGSSPRLTRLNTSDWSRAMAKARKATKQLAFDLVDVYTRRASTQGYRYREDTPWQHEMEESFPYQETPDQLAAIADIKADMQSPRPMDRLVCGDVGFGKTEVALRAAFKATQDNKQVMVLCPTTILAQQHYSTFKDRFEPFGVKVEVLSRFRTPAQQKQALADFSEGTVSVLVGTHRLLSRDVNPHDLGLVIIDEEQRFGVAHKEQLKNMRESIDVLTLSATPIPRTMQMGLSGVRDMSLILTPPDDRRPVEVHVGEWDPDVVSDAIRREMARGGQIYYVSNRVRSIDEAVKRVQAAAGEARVGVAHGKMTKEQLEDVMENFAAGELDVLVATTIIESGIDNPHTNTLIIEDSQRLGLAQMYQLKGRVGRSSTQAYAYFLFPDNIPLTEEAVARLTALGEHTDLGSGMRVAMRDLEIRGAGSLLGAEQSGNMSAVGFDLFAQMLSTAVNNAREGNSSAKEFLPPALSDIVVNVPDHTYFPEEYLPDADERVLYYRKIASADTIDAVNDIYEELLAKHPEMPQASVNQFEKARLKAFANEHGIKLISVSAGKLTVEPFALTKSQASSLRRKAGRYLADKKKMAVPLRVVVPGYGKEEEAGDVGMLTNVLAYLQKLVEEGKESGERPASGRGEAPRSSPSSAASGPSARSSRKGSSTAGSSLRRSTSRSTRAQSLGVTNYVGRQGSRR